MFVFHHHLFAGSLVGWRLRALWSHRKTWMPVHLRLTLKHLQREYSWGLQLLCVGYLVHDLGPCFMTYQCEWGSVSIDVEQISLIFLELINLY